MMKSHSFALFCCFFRYYRFGIVLLSLCALIGCAVPPEIEQSDEIDSSAVQTLEGVKLRLHGSHSLGSRLIPDLVEAFFRQKGASTIIRQSDIKANRIVIKGILPNNMEHVGEIQLQDSGMTFKSLGGKQCDAGFTTRRIKPKEIKKLASLGKMTSQESEHVLALDGIAIIVERENPVETLTIDQIDRIFRGKIKDWSTVGGTPGPITVYAPFGSSGTYEAFQQTVLKNKRLTNNAKEIQSDVELSKKVADDKTAIGFVKFAHVRQAKVIAITDGVSRPLTPEAFHIGTEDYLLSHRLYLYVPENSTNATAREFVEFVLSNEGQTIVALNNLVDLNIKTTLSGISTETISTPVSGAEEYVDLTKKAERLSLNIRFQLESFALDNKAQRDITRMAEFLARSPQFQNRPIALLGFADNLGEDAYNLELSKRRAEAVAEKLRQHGLSPMKIVGFGEDIPVASNKTEEGRAKNRRVEVWLLNPDFPLLPSNERAETPQPPGDAPQLPVETPQPEVDLSERDPDRNSGRNGTAAGATRIEPDDTEPGSITYDGGDKTDWYQVRITEAGQFTYRITQDSPNTRLFVQLYPPVPDSRSLPEHPFEELVLVGQDTQSYTIDTAQPGRYYAKIFVQNPGEVSEHVIYTEFTSARNEAEGEAEGGAEQEIVSTSREERPLPENPQPPRIIIFSPDISVEHTVTIIEETLLITGQVEADIPIYRIEIMQTEIPLEAGDGFDAENNRYVREFIYPVPDMEIGDHVPITIVAWDTRGQIVEERFNIFRIPVDPEQTSGTDSPSSIIRIPSESDSTESSASGRTPGAGQVTTDTTAPRITLLAPEDGSTVNQAVLEIRGRVEDENQIGQISVNGTPIPIATPRGFDADQLHVENFVHRVKLDLGMNDIVINAQDVFGNPVSRTIQIRRAE